MVEKNQLIRVERGIYLTEGGDQDDYYFFQLKNRRCIYSFSSALYLHGMTDRIPFKKAVTVYKGYNSSHIKDGTAVHHVSKELDELGVTECRTVFGNTVKVYDSYTGRHITNKVYFKNHKMYIKKYGKWIDLYDFITNKNMPFTYAWDNEVKMVYK